MERTLSMGIPYRCFGCFVLSMCLFVVYEFRVLVFGMYCLFVVELQVFFGLSMMLFDYGY